MNNSARWKALMEYLSEYPQCTKHEKKYISSKDLTLPVVEYLHKLFDYDISELRDTKDLPKYYIFLGPAEKNGEVKYIGVYQVDRICTPKLVELMLVPVFALSILMQKLHFHSVTDSEGFIASFKLEKSKY